MSRLIVFQIVTGFLVVAASSLGFAFDIEPEYQGLAESERERIESPREIDREYQSIANAYTLPDSWNRSYALSKRAFDTSVGSLSNQHFMIYSRAKFEADLTAGLKFQFRYISQQDREINQVRHVVELNQRVLSWLSLNLYGEMSHYKRSNDFGFAILVSPTDTWENRVYVTYHDFTRGNHNDQPDRFIGEDPLTFGATSSWNQKEWRVRAGFRIDRAVRWNIPQEGKMFSYEKRLAFMDASHTLSHGDTVTLRAQKDSTFKGCEALPASTVTDESWLVDRTLIRASYLQGKDEEPWNVEYALMSASRRWINQFGSQIFHQNILPSLTARWSTYRRGEAVDHAQVAIEMTDFQTYGDLALTTGGQRTDSTEARLQTAYEFGFQNEAKLMLALNFDLDEWSNVPSFEGGNARFRIDF